VSGSAAEERFDELDKRRLRSDFLSQVREVCRLHLAKNPLTRDAEIEELEDVDGVRFDHLVVSYHRGPWPKRLLVGAYEVRSDPRTSTASGRLSVIGTTSTSGVGLSRFARGERGGRPGQTERGVATPVQRVSAGMGQQSAESGSGSMRFDEFGE
jgi:hypothetical protein